MNKLLFLIVIFFAVDANAQQQKIYYNFPENIKSKVSLRINETVNASKKDTYSSQTILIVTTKGNDTTLVWIVKFSKDIPELNAVINNSNRLFKCVVNNNEIDIPIINNTDLDWAEPVRKEEIINNKKAINMISMLWAGWLVEFTFRKQIATIIDDKLYQH